MSLNASGYTATRSADFLTAVQQRYEVATGLTPDWASDQVIGVLAGIMADLLGEEDQAVQAVYDSRVRNNATGIQLDDLGTIIGVTRNPATYSVAFLTLAGTTGMILPAGIRFQGGDPGFELTQWATLEDLTFDGFGNANGQARALTSGPVTMSLMALTTVTPYPGLTGAAGLATTIGDAQETDGDFRARQQASLQIAGSASANAIYAKIAALDYVDAARVLENDDHVFQTIEGVLMDPNSIEVVVYPSGLTTAQKHEIATTIYENTPAGTQTLGAVTYSVTKADGLSKTIRWAWATGDATTIAIATTPETGYVVADYETALEDAVTAWFADLVVGQDVTLLDMYGLAATMLDSVTGLPMIKSATVLIDGAGANKSITAVKIATLTSVTVT